MPSTSATEPTTSMRCSTSPTAAFGQSLGLQPHAPAFAQPQLPPSHLHEGPHLQADFGQSPPQPHLPVVAHPHEPSTHLQPSPHLQIAIVMRDVLYW